MLLYWLEDNICDIWTQISVFLMPASHCRQDFFSSFFQEIHHYQLKRQLKYKQCHLQHHPHSHPLSLDNKSSPFYLQRLVNRLPYPLEPQALRHFCSAGVGEELHLARFNGVDMAEVSNVSSQLIPQRAILFVLVTGVVILQVIMEGLVDGQEEEADQERGEVVAVLPRCKRACHLRITLHAS
jgi:hypothetical protein